MATIGAGAINVRLYDMFRSKFKLPEPDARDVSIEMIEVIKEQAQMTQVTKFDQLMGEIAALRTTMEFRFEKIDARFEALESRMDARFEALENQTDARFAAFENRTAAKFAEHEGKFATHADLLSTKSELLRWMFIFWSSQLIATFSFLLLFLRK